MLYNAGYQVDALEERIVILVKEKKYLESLLNRVSKSHPIKDTNRIVNQIMNITDSLAQLERDRFKIEDNIIKLEETSVRGNNSKTDLKLEKSLQMEKDNLKSLTYDYDKKINEKKEQIKSLENEMKELETHEKNNANMINDYEFKFKQMQNELIEAKDELRKYKTVYMTSSTVVPKFSAEEDFAIGNNIKYKGDYRNTYYDSFDLNDGDRIETLKSEEYKPSPRHRDNSSLNLSNLNLNFRS
jgi:chromosome segregation ATPase